MSDLSVDYNETIQNDIRNGNQESVKSYLKYESNFINKLYKHGTLEWTLLIAACYYQQEKIVQMLINEFNADIEGKGAITDYMSDTWDIVRGASPLYTAVMVNNFTIVKFLVEYGMANVNHLTETQSTPLRKACCNGNIKMIKFLLRHGANPHRLSPKKRTILMDVVQRDLIDLVIYLINDIKCNFNQQDVDGVTALHIAVKHGCLGSTNILLSHGALNLRDKPRNITPLEWAATHLKEDFVTAFDGHCLEIEWIEARELLASQLILNRSNPQNINKATEYLTIAFKERLIKNLPKSRAIHTLKIFENRHECESLNDLNQLKISGSREDLCIEALLIQERILGTRSTNYRTTLRNVRDVFVEINQYNICLGLWFYELDLLRKYNISFNKEDLNELASLFETLLTNNKLPMFIHDFCKFLTIITDQLSLYHNSETFEYNQVTLLNLIAISARLLLNEDVEKEQKISLDDGQILIKQIQSIVNKKYVINNSGSSLLHLCCNDNTEGLGNIEYPCLMTVRLLVFCGIDVDAMDSEGDTALHILARYSDEEEIMAIIDFLHKKAGAHTDFTNIYGVPPTDYHDTITDCAAARFRRLRQKFGVLPLKCRCAQLVKYNKLPYQELLSSSLVKFVKRH